MNQNINRTNHLQPVSLPLAAVLTVAKQGQQIIQTKGLVARIEQGATKKREPYILLTLQDKNTKQKVFMWDSTYTEIKVRQSASL